MEVSTMFYFCRYCVFTWDGRDVNASLINYRRSSSKNNQSTRSASVLFTETLACETIVSNGYVLGIKVHLSQLGAISLICQDILSGSRLCVQ